MRQLEFIDPDKIKKYRGYKVAVNNSIKYIRVTRGQRLIELNREFFMRITNAQRIFLLEWHRRRLRYSNEYDCDKKTFEYCTKHLNIEPEEIYNLFRSNMFRNGIERKNRLFQLVTISKEEYQWQQFKQIILNVWNRIRKIFVR